MAYGRILLCIVVVLVHTPVCTRAESCEDLDKDSCSSLVAHNLDLCLEEVFAYTVCQRTCGNCPVEPVTCYHCEEPLEDHTQCLDTMECDVGDKCLLLERTSSVEPTLYTMRCASTNVCDGIGLLIGRRDLSTHCCTEDLCNKPDFAPPTEPLVESTFTETTYSSTTTTTPTTTQSIKTTTITTPTTTSTTLTTTPTTTTSTTTTPTTTTSTTTTTTTTTARPTTTVTDIPKISCRRDILIMVEDSTDRSSAHYIKEFLQMFFQSIQVSQTSILVSLALVDNDVHPQWHLDSYVTSESLISNIDNLNFRHYTDVINFNALSDYVNDMWVGDRRMASNIVIVLTDQSSYSGTMMGRRHSGGMMMHHGYASTTTTNNAVNILKNTRRFIAVNSGYDSIRANEFGEYATDVFNIPGYYDLYTILDNVLNAICQ